MWAHTIFSFYNHTGDKLFLKKVFPVAEEFLLFLIDKFIEDRGIYMVVRQCEGLDESTAREKTNDI